MNLTRLLAASAVVGLWAFSANAADLRPEDAPSHIGETATVCGVVASAKFEAHARSQPTLLDLGKAYPHALLAPRPFQPNVDGLLQSASGMNAETVYLMRTVADSRAG
jgi:hypothetical protein